MSVIFRDFRDFWQIAELKSRADVQSLSLLFQNLVCWYCLLRTLMRSQEKFWIYSFLSISLEMSWNFQQSTTLHHRAKAILLLNSFGIEILWKINFFLKKATKYPTLNFHISKIRKNSESKFIFFESSFNFLHNSVMICVLYPDGYISEPSTSPLTTSGATTSGSKVKSSVLRSLICAKFKDCCDSHN